MKIYNTMTRKLEPFTPIEPGKIRMYVCGPTVYNYIHIGNARSVVAFDVVRRYLEYRGYAVHYVSNFTDVDDKIIKAAKAENTTPAEISERYIKAFYEDINALGVKRADENPRATEFIAPMIAFIQDLIDKGFAYVAEGDVYFRVERSEGYAALANKNLAELLDGASGRVNEDDAKKESPADFALWKSVASDRDEDKFDSPWGAGRPGWHIECSVMSNSLLGETLDIHGGGADLEFPHHTNEIAQSEAHNGVKFVNTWMHNGFVNIDGEKMSKSLGNFKTVREMIAGGLNPQVLRFFLATTHYRRPLDFTDDALERAEKNLTKIENAYRNLSELGDADPSDFEEKFIRAMDEDFNIANGLSVFYDFIGWVNKGNGGKRVQAFFNVVLEILGLSFNEETDLDAEIQALVDARQIAREVRDFAKADEIRDELKARGIVLEDTKEGVKWHRN